MRIAVRLPDPEKNINGPLCTNMRAVENDAVVSSSSSESAELRDPAWRSPHASSSPASNGERLSYTHIVIRFHSAPISPSGWKSQRGRHPLRPRAALLSRRPGCPEPAPPPPRPGLCCGGGLRARRLVNRLPLLVPSRPCVTPSLKRKLERLARHFVCESARRACAAFPRFAPRSLRLCGFCACAYLIASLTVIP